MFPELVVVGIIRPTTMVENFAEVICMMETGTTPIEYVYNGIAPNQSNSVSFKPLCGLLSQEKYLPMMWGGLVFEFEIISDKTEAFADPFAGANFRPEDTGSDW